MSENSNIKDIENSNIKDIEDNNIKDIENNNDTTYLNKVFIIFLAVFL